MEYESTTVRACKAVLEWKFNNDKKNKQSYFSNKYNVSTAYLNKVNNIRKLSIELFNGLLQGNKLSIPEISSKPTGNVTAILEYLQGKR